MLLLQIYIELYNLNFLVLLKVFFNICDFKYEICIKFIGYNYRFDNY